MSIPTQATRRRFRGCPPLVAGMLSTGLLLAAAAGCGSFAAQGLNSEGVRLCQQAQHHQAMQRFQEAVNTDPNDPDGYYNLAATYHRLGVLEGRDDYLDQAENYYNQCLDKDENHRECYRGLAVLLAEQGRHEDAFRLVEGWCDRQPGSSEAKIELARLCEEYNYRAEAKEHLIAALKIDPDNARALAALGNIREQMGDHAQALNDYQRSLASDQFQPQLASRATALRSKLGATVYTTAPTDGTRLVDRESATSLQ
ncbi:MAG: tetratricopeptide repeat protein [Pirellulales bacterium]|nr:tetratricopeptide repeat protein [Pirellulales bacterium]